MSNEQFYFDVLKKIARGYAKSSSIINNPERYGGTDDALETLEMVYDNLQLEAERAIKGKRRPKQ